MAKESFPLANPGAEHPIDKTSGKYDRPVRGIEGKKSNISISWNLDLKGASPAGKLSIGIPVTVASISDEGLDAVLDQLADYLEAEFNAFRDNIFRAKTAMDNQELNLFSQHDPSLPGIADLPEGEPAPVNGEEVFAA